MNELLTAISERPYAFAGGFVIGYVAAQATFYGIGCALRHFRLWPYNEE